MTTTNRTADVVAALRKRFGSAKNLCRVLGVNENLLRPDKLAFDDRGNRFGRDQVENLNGSAPTGGSAAHQLRAAIEAALKDHEDLPQGLTKALLEAAEKHAPLGDAGDEEPAPIMRNGKIDPALLGEAIERAERDGDMARVASLEKMASALRNGEDDMPLNALHGGSLNRGGGPGGVFAAKRAGAMDRALDSACKKAPGLRDIVVGGVADRSVDRRPGMTARQQQRFEAKFPEIARTY